jgi:hypothetical protein
MFHGDRSTLLNFMDIMSKQSEDKHLKSTAINHDDMGDFQNMLVDVPGRAVVTTTNFANTYMRRGQIMMTWVTFKICSLMFLAELWTQQPTLLILI